MQSLDWKTVGYTATEAAIISSFANAMIVAAQVAAETYPIEGISIPASAVQTVAPKRNR